MSLGGSADREAFDAQGGLTNAHGHALAIFAASAYARIKFHIVTDHRDSGQSLWPVANQSCAFDRIALFAVFHPPGLAGSKDKFSIGDVNLTAAKVDRINTAIDGSDDLFGIPVAVEHDGIGHPWHG